MLTLNWKKLKAGRSLTIAICVGVLVFAMYSSPLNAKCPEGMVMSMERLNSAEEFSLAPEANRVELDDGMMDMQLADSPMYDAMDFRMSFSSRNSGMNMLPFLMSVMESAKSNTLESTVMVDEVMVVMSDMNRPMMTGERVRSGMAGCSMPNETPLLEGDVMPFAGGNLMAEAVEGLPMPTMPS
ncbi:MAG: hypothetical protein OEV49_05075 [candidate division Zixibacteria bacterium]|nr:hypothetical protein [candidate division Zixibacteria bacterium]MDH3936128.1 hypothetical protein [candidate division Zixibacteria bacterium]MDH4035836.1 hypothetical protein [candidate division Zixibacteria bacterium]